MLLTGDIVRKGKHKGKVIARRVESNPCKLFVQVAWDNGKTSWHRDDHRLELL